MNQALNFILFVLPNLPKLKKPKKKGGEYDRHKARQIISKIQLENFKGGKDFLINLHWEKLYDIFKERNLYPTYCREYENNDYLILELISKEKVK